MDILTGNIKRLYRKYLAASVTGAVVISIRSYAVSVFCYDCGNGCLDIPESECAFSPFLKTVQWPGRSILFPAY